MKNIIKHILLLLGVSAAAVSCENWLDVTPSSQIRAEEHYSTAEGFQQTLTGCYIAMTKKELYGQTLTWHTVEMLGRQYDARRNSAADDYDMDRYNYTSTKSVKLVETTWEKMYSVIVNANEALGFIDKNRSIIDSVNYRILKGEFLAVRAYLHFDLMRLFGCSNLAARSDLNTKVTIPYLTAVDKNVAPQLSYAKTIQNIIADLTEAARLLEIDPIRKAYPDEIYKQANVDGYYNFRTQHLNYYAVKTLLARVCMWEGSDQNKRLALSAANEVIRDSKDKSLFQFTAPDKVATTEMVFPSEHIFSLNVTNLVKLTEVHLNREYSSDDRQKRTLCIKNAIANSLFEITGVGITDCRYKQLYHNTDYWPEGTKTPSKLYQQTSTGAYYTYKDLMPLMRIPEVYYIAAECYTTGPERDLAKARELLDVVRTNRAVYEKLDENLDQAGVMTEIDKEYKKEFICEGVAFYFYKRLGYTKLPRQSDVIAASVEVGDAIYMLPYPEFELQSGRVQ